MSSEKSSFTYEITSAIYLKGGLSAAAENRGRVKKKKKKQLISNS